MRTAMLAPIGTMCSFTPRPIGSRTAPLSGTARTPYSEGDIHAGGETSQIGCTLPATKSAPVSSNAATSRSIHAGSGRTSSSVNASTSPRARSSAVLTACDLPGVATNTYFVSGERDRAAAAAIPSRVPSVEPLSAITISNRSRGQRCMASASSVCASSARRLRVAMTTDTNVTGYAPSLGPQ